MKTVKSLLVVCTVLMAAAAVYGFINYQNDETQAGLQKMYKDERRASESKRGIKSAVQNEPKPVHMPVAKPGEKENDKAAVEEKASYKSKSQGRKRNKKIELESFSRKAVDRKFHEEELASVDTVAVAK